MPDARRGDLVQIHRVILEPSMRPENLPPETKAVPYECWIKGFLLEAEADFGDQVRVESFIGRELKGTLAALNPVYDHNFGRPRRELLSIGSELRRRLKRD